MNSENHDRVTIRPATAEDYDAIVRAWRAGGLSVRLQGRDRREAFVEQLRRFPETYLVAVDGERIVGVVFGTHDLRKGWINRLVVVPAYRGRGIAVSLVEACETALHREGIEIIAAQIEPHNDPSAQLFRKLGYKTDVPVLYFRKLTRPEA